MPCGHPCNCAGRPETLEKLAPGIPSGLLPIFVQMSDVCTFGDVRYIQPLRRFLNEPGVFIRLAATEHVV